MKTIHTDQIAEAVEKLCMDANYLLSPDIAAALENAACRERSPNGRMILESLQRNAEIARNEAMAICQDTGMAVVFLEIGQEVHITGGSLTEAVNEVFAGGIERFF